MSRRPIKNEEKVLIERLLKSIPDGHRFAIPAEVENLGGGGSGGIQLAARGEYSEDLVEASYADEDGRTVFITLTVNEFKELYELDLWKVDFSSLIKYPGPADIAFSE
jgi:hypothetical protein